MAGVVLYVFTLDVVRVLTAKKQNVKQIHSFHSGTYLYPPPHPSSPPLPQGSCVHCCVEEKLCIRTLFVAVIK